MLKGPLELNAIVLGSNAPPSHTHTHTISPGNRKKGQIMWIGRGSGVIGVRTVTIYDTPMHPRKNTHTRAQAHKRAHTRTYTHTVTAAPLTLNHYLQS